MSGKYQIIEQLAEGGTARVFLAATRGLGGFRKLVVLKVPRPQVVGRADARTMFLAEARLSARLNHRNIVEVNEVIEKDGVPVIVMQYLDGQSLAELRERAGAELDLCTHVSILEAVLLGLNHAHNLRGYDGTPLEVVHRDVSPHNVMLTYDGQIKVLDFGIAKSSTPGDATEVGTIKGKLTYMAPEQANGGTVDRRSDLFCVGIMLCEAVTGERFWNNVSEAQLLNLLFAGKVPQLPAGPGIDPVMAEILRRALAPEPAERYATAMEFRADLEQYRQRLGCTAGTAPRLTELLQRHFERERDKRDRLIEQRAVMSSSPPGGSMAPHSERAAMTLGVRDAATQLEIPGRRLKRSVWHRVRGIAVRWVWQLSALGAIGVVGVVAEAAYGGVLPVAGSIERTSASFAHPSRRADAGATVPAGANSAAEVLSVDAGAVSCGRGLRAHGLKPTIDDFNKIDHVIDTYDGRMGEWYSYHDGSNLPPAIGIEHVGFAIAMHVVGGPFAVWGAGVGADLSQECPYDASVYKGVRVVARGTTPVWVKVYTDENVKPPLGVCPAEEERCHDAYQKKIELHPTRWQVFDVAWETLKQRGFGRKFRFDPKRINHIQFEWYENLEIDCWVDHVGFY